MAYTYYIFTVKDKRLNSEFTDDDDDEDSSADDSSDDDNGQINNSEFDKEFFKTLASLKTKDPKIYDKQIVFFNNDTDNLYMKKEKKKQMNDGMTVKDFERKVMLEKGGHYVDGKIIITILYYFFQKKKKENNIFFLFY